jgi:hypothetical protein
MIVMIISVDDRDEDKKSLNDDDDDAFGSRSLNCMNTLNH